MVMEWGGMEMAMVMGTDTGMDMVMNMEVAITLRKESIRVFLRA